MPNQHAAIDVKRVEPCFECMRVLARFRRSGRNGRRFAIARRIPRQYAVRRAERFELVHPRSRARADAVQQHQRQRADVRRARFAIADRALRRNRDSLCREVREARFQRGGSIGGGGQSCGHGRDVLSGSSEERRITSRDRA
jgi:hypothetical protein